MIYRGSSAAMSEHAAAFIIAEAYAAIADHGRFSLVLAGGNSPRPLYRHLAAGVSTELMRLYGVQLPENCDYEQKGEIIPMPWEQSWLFWGDERCVPFMHPDSNYRMASETLLLNTIAKADHIFRIDAELPDTEEAAENYEAVIRAFFSQSMTHSPDGIPVFDLVLLGLGEDGHTASLFADKADSLRETNRWVAAVDAPLANPPGRRITLTLPVINHARVVLFFTSGNNKAALAEKIVHQQVSDVPAALVAPRNGKIIWFTSQE
jgi:6-phosphogluconolactonase